MVSNFSTFSICQCCLFQKISPLGSRVPVLELFLIFYHGLMSFIQVVTTLHQGRPNINAKNLQETKFKVILFLRIEIVLISIDSTQHTGLNTNMWLIGRSLFGKKLCQVISHWKWICKFSQPPAKSYETLVNHYRDPWIAIKMHFFFH